jgi:hypothetical protein
MSPEEADILTHIHFLWVVRNKADDDNENKQKLKTHIYVKFPNSCYLHYRPGQ